MRRVAAVLVTLGLGVAVPWLAQTPLAGSPASVVPSDADAGSPDGSGDGGAEPAEVEPAGEDIGALEPETHVMPPSSPTQVHVGLSVEALTHVDPPSETFPHYEAQVMLSLRWQDPRLGFDEAEEGATRRIYLGREANTRLRDMWHPDVGFENEDGTRQVDGKTLVIRHDGTVVLEEVLTSSFRARMDLARFPFDEQRFHFAVQSITWNVNKVELVIDEEKSGFDGGRQRGSLEWHISGMESRALEVRAARSSHRFSRAAFYLRAERVPGFYLWKLVVPLLLIVVFTWSAFWMTGEAAGTRMQRAFIALLSVVAFHHVVSDHLPRIPNLTFMDSVVYLAFVFTGLTMVQIIGTHRAMHAGNEERAARLDRISRWAFPAAFVLGLTTLWVVYRI